ncbi:MAG: hypothetical protein ACE5R4_11490 [Armatimonadota bacterium]
MSGVSGTWRRALAVGVACVVLLPIWLAVGQEVEVAPGDLTLDSVVGTIKAATDACRQAKSAPIWQYVPGEDEYARAVGPLLEAGAGALPLLHRLAQDEGLDPVERRVAQIVATRIGQPQVDSDLVVEQLSVCKRAEAGLAEAGDDAVQRQRVARQAVQELVALASEVGDRSPFLAYLHARLLLVAGDMTAAKSMLAQTRKASRLSPEALFLRAQIDYLEGGPTALGPPYDRLGRCLPVSAWGRLRDAALTAHPVETDRPVVPGVRADSLRRVALAFEDVELHEPAAAAYMEAAYSAFAVQPVSDAYLWRECWFSLATAELWRASGRNALLCGQRARAADALAKAYFSCAPAAEAEIAAALKTVTNGQEQAPVALPSVDAEKLREIAGLYASMRMHPRAVWALTLGDENLDTELAPLREVYEGEWSQLMRRYCAMREDDSFLFGQKVSPETRAAELQIPWPCEALGEPEQP